MLYVNLQDGSVQTYDLLTSAGYEAFQESSNNPDWHKTVTGVSLQGPGHRADLPLPKNLGQPLFDAEALFRDQQPVAEKVSASVGELYITLTRYLGESGRFRMDVRRLGRRRWRRS